MVNAPRGFSTLELVIAFAVLALSLTAMVTVMYGSQTLAADSAASREASRYAATLLGDLRAAATSDFLSASSSRFSVEGDQVPFTVTLDVLDLSSCLKAATSTVLWMSGSRTLRAELATLIADTTTLRQLGNDCEAEGPEGDWRRPERVLTDALALGRPTAVDAVDGWAYVGTDAVPYFAIADLRAAETADEVFVPFTNGFDAGARINALDAITVGRGEARRTYVYAARHRTPAQLIAIDATDSRAPFLTSEVSLSPCVTGSFPQGWFVHAYGGMLYATTRETAGPEFHVFSLADPAHPLEVTRGGACKGFELTDTVEQFAVREQNAGGRTKRFAYLVTNESDKEVRVLDVTVPSAIREVASVDLPGNQDALSLALLGTRLYIGRQSTAHGPELYVFDVSDPENDLPLIGSAEVGASVVSLQVSGPLAFLATTRSGRELQTWDIASTTDIRLQGTAPLPLARSQGIEFSDGLVLAVSQGRAALEIYRPRP